MSMRVGVRRGRLPVTQACPCRAAPARARWSTPPSDRPCPGRRSLAASGAWPGEAGRSGPPPGTSGPAGGWPAGRRCSGSPRGPWPLGPPEACSCGYGLATSPPTFDAVAVVVLVLDVVARSRIRQGWVGTVRGRHDELGRWHLRSSRRLARREAIFGFSKGSRGPLGPPEACSCGYGSDGHVVTSLPWPIAVLVVDWRSCRCSGCSQAREPASSCLRSSSAPGRRRERSGKAPTRRAAACGRLEDVLKFLTGDLDM
jgi:hypothetical protein